MSRRSPVVSRVLDMTADVEPVPVAAPSAPKGLISKLAEVMTVVGRIPKHGHNAHFNYDYVTEADIAEAVRSELASRHVMIVPSVKAVSWRQGEKICTLLMTYRIHDGESGETLEFDGIGEGQDSGDKATYKALTGANKYALMKLFQIPTGDDPEKDSEQIGSAPQKQKRGYKPPTPEARQAVMDRAPYPDRDAAPPAPSVPASEERQAVLGRIVKLAAALKLDPQERKDVAMTYLGTTDTKKADIAALVDLVKFLELRCEEKGVKAA